MKIKEIKKISTLQIYFIFQLRNKLYIKNQSLNKKEITFKNHMVWLKNFKKNKNKIFLITKSNKNIGYIRIEKYEGFLDTSWALDKNYHGKGFMTRALKKITKISIDDMSKFRACILKKNAASIQVAKKCGFKRRKIHQGYYIYEKNL